MGKEKNKNLLYAKQYFLRCKTRNQWEEPYSDEGVKQGKSDSFYTGSKVLYRSGENTWFNI